MKTILRLSALLFPAISIAVHAGQERWTTGEGLLFRNEKPVFLSGVNYVPPVNWHTSFEDWNPVDIERDLAALRRIGVKCLRTFPLWPLFQPAPDRLDPVNLGRLDAFMDMAAKHGLRVQPSPMTGWMSGFTFLPDWADKSLFTDPRQIEAERFLVRTMAERLRRHPALCSWDFGNEINVLIQFMKPDVTPDAVDRWMQAVYAAFKAGDPDHPVTNGVGTGFDEYFNIRAIARSSDFMSVHSYPTFHRTIMLDPPNGQRSTYSVNYITEWAAMTGKAVLMQETGSTEAVLTPHDRLQYLRVTFASSWAEGAAGYFWWCSHDIRPDYRVRVPGLRLEYSVAGQQDSRLSRFEQKLGLLNEDNEEKDLAREYRDLIRTVDHLGQGWKDLRPVVYVLVPGHDEYFRLMLELINPFTLLKQAHADVRFLRDGSPVPEGAAGVVIPCMGVSDSGKKHLRRYLEMGGTVYQSFYNDFADSVRFTGVEGKNQWPKVWFEQRMGMLSADRFAILPSCRIREIEIGGGVEPVAVLCTGMEMAWEWDFGRPLFVHTRVGKGHFYYLAADLETALTDVYDPWTADQSVRIYQSLVPETDMDVDNKFVEWFHKARNGEELLVLINHSEAFQDVRIQSRRPVRLTGYLSGRPLGQGRSAAFRMEPGEVLFCRVR